MSWRRMIRRATDDADRAREIQAHLEHHIDDLVASGLSRDDARRAALKKFGNVTGIREELYEMNSFSAVDAIWRDLCFACRLLRKNPTFTLAAVLTLGLGIGANTAIYSVVDALLLRPLPYPDPDRLALVSTRYRSPRGESTQISQDGRTWDIVRDNVKSADVAVYSDWVTGVNVAAQDRAAYVQQQRVGAGFFRVLGVAPLFGREFAPDEDVPGGPPVAVLSHAFWTRSFDADPTIVGRTILLRGEPHAVIGVMPAGFLSTAPADLFTPLRPSTRGEGGGTNYAIVARLGADTSWAQAGSEIAALGQMRWQQQRDAANVSAIFTLVPLQQAMSAEVRRPLLVLWGAVVLVLLIVCANLASLLLARAGRRTREVATRMALGSGRAGVIRQLLVESVVLAILGGGLGLAFGYVGLRGLRVLATDAFGIWQPIAFDARVLAVAAGVSLVTSLFFGLAPALHATRLDVSAALAESSARGATVRSTHWARVLLVVGEVAVGVLLVVSAALLVRTFVNLRRLDPGIDPRGVVTATLSLQDARYATSEGMNRLFDDSLARIRRLPGVTAAAVSLGLPYQRLLNLGFRPVGGPGDAEAKPGITNLAYVTPGFFEALRLPLRAGRVVDDSDRRGSRPVAVVNDAFAATYLRDREPIGSRIGIAGDAREIVGIVGGTLQLPSWGEGNDPLRRQPTVYVPAAQTNDQSLALWHTWFQPSWIVRSSLPAGVTMAAVRRAIEAADAQLPLAALRTLERVEGTALASQQFLMTLITALGAIAALLAVVGIHGLVANAVVERTRELGVRLALGATVGQAMRAVAVPGVCLALIGIVIGSGLGLAGARVLRAFLWGVSATDPRTFVGVAASLLLVAVVASVVPALRVLRLDPASTLRHE